MCNPPPRQFCTLQACKHGSSIFGSSFCAKISSSVRCGLSFFPSHPWIYSTFETPRVLRFGPSHLFSNLEDWWRGIEEEEEGVAAVGNTRRRRSRPCRSAKAKIVKGVRGDRSTVPFTCHPGNPTPPSSSSSSSSSSNPPFSNPPPLSSTLRCWK